MGSQYPAYAAPGRRANTDRPTRRRVPEGRRLPSPVHERPRHSQPHQPCRRCEAATAASVAFRPDGVACDGRCIQRARPDRVSASMMLGNNGRVWVHFDSASPNGPASWDLNTPLMRLPVGGPTRTARHVDGYLRGGVYRRPFTNGLVIVNPTSRAVVVRLQQPRRLLSGQMVSRVTAGAFSGLVLTG